MYTVVQQIFIPLVASFMCPLTPETLPTCHLHDVRYGFITYFLYPLERTVSFNTGSGVPKGFSRYTA